MEMKYDRQKHNRTYYEKNSENIKRKQREKRAKMKAALQQLEASMLGGTAQPDSELRRSSLENQEIENDSPVPEPESMSSNFFQHIRECQRLITQGSHKWFTGCISSCLQSIKEDHREQAEQYTAVACDFLKSVRLTMIVNNISNILNIIKFIIMLYNNIKW